MGVIKFAFGVRVSRVKDRTFKVLIHCARSYAVALCQTPGQGLGVCTHISAILTCSHSIQESFNAEMETTHAFCSTF